MCRNLGRIQPAKRTGEEPIGATGRRLLEFWQWAFSDLLDNINRGLLAEYLVAAACGCDTGVKDVWASYDLRMPEGIKIEVKTSGRIQAWAQQRPSSSSFGIGKARAWDADNGSYGKPMLRHADVYVFCVHAHEDQATVNPLDTSQWDFHVVPTSVLEQRHGDRKSISLETVRRLAKRKVQYEDLAEAVREAKAENRHQ
jgi:hypothetical protein